MCNVISPKEFCLRLRAAWFLWFRLNLFEIPTTKMSTTASNLLSNQWISYGCWMLFKQIFTACFFSASSLSFDIFIFISISLSHFASNSVITFIGMKREPASRKIIQHILRLFGNSDREKWIELPEKFSVLSAKASWVFHETRQTKPWALWQNGYARNVFICFIVISLLLLPMASNTFSFSSQCSCTSLNHSFLKRGKYPMFDACMSFALCLFRQFYIDLHPTKIFGHDLHKDNIKIPSIHPCSVSRCECCDSLGKCFVCFEYFALCMNNSNDQAELQAESNYLANVDLNTKSFSLLGAKEKAHATDNFCASTSARATSKIYVTRYTAKCFYLSHAECRGKVYDACQAKISIFRS